VGEYEFTVGVGIIIGRGRGRKHALLVNTSLHNQKKWSSPLTRRCVIVVEDVQKAGEREGAYGGVWGVGCGDEGPLDSALGRKDPVKACARVRPMIKLSKSRVIVQMRG
jgi:hypothetical protein